MSLEVIRPRRGFPDDAMYCPRCQVVWPRGYPYGHGALCPQPRPPGIAYLYSTRYGSRCGTTLIPAEDVYQAQR